MIRFSIKTLLHGKWRYTVFLLLCILMNISIVAVAKLYHNKELQLNHFLDEIVIKGRSYHDGDTDTLVNYKLVDVMEEKAYLTNLMVEESYIGYVPSDDEETKTTVTLLGFNDLEKYMNSADNILSDVNMVGDFCNDVKLLEEGQLPSILLDKEYMEDNFYQVGDVFYINLLYNRMEVNMAFEVKGYVKSSDTNSSYGSIVTFNSVREKIEEFGYLKKIMTTDPIYHYQNITYEIIDARVYDEYNTYLKEGKLVSVQTVTIPQLLGSTKLILDDKPYLLGKETFNESIETYKLLESILTIMYYIGMSGISIYLILYSRREVYILRSIGVKRYKAFMIRMIQYGLLLLLAFSVTIISTIILYIGFTQNAKIPISNLFHIIIRITTTYLITIIINIIVIHREKIIGIDMRL